MPRAVQEEEAEGKADGGKGLENPFKVNPYKSKDNVATATTAGTEPVAAAAAAVAEVAAVSVRLTAALSVWNRPCNSPRAPFAAAG